VSVKLTPRVRLVRAQGAAFYTGEVEVREDGRRVCLLGGLPARSTAAEAMDDAIQSKKRLLTDKNADVRCGYVR
jgi:hypothetical protein